MAGLLGLSISMSSSAELPLPTSPSFKAVFWQLKVLKKQEFGSFFSLGRAPASSVVSRTPSSHACSGWSTVSQGTAVAMLVLVSSTGTLQPPSPALP